RNCIDDRSNVRCRGLAGQPIRTRAIVQAAADPGHLSFGGQALQRLVDRRARSEIQEINRRPHLPSLGRDAVRNACSEAECGSARHLSEIYRTFRTTRSKRLTMMMFGEARMWRGYGGTWL